MKKVSLLFLCLLLSGCATIGPAVTRDEVRKARDELRVKALKYQLGHLSRVVNIGQNLVMNLPKDARQGRFPYTGFYTAKIDKDIKKLFNLGRERGVAIIAVIKNSPADTAGFQTGDVITKIGQRYVRDSQDLSYIKFVSGRKYDIEIIRDGTEQVIPLPVGEKPVQLSFQMVDTQDVNAGAVPGKIFVTYGLVKFAASDDEIAVVLAHELAHITRGHFSKQFGTNILTGLIALGVGAAAESISPGSGNIVIRGTGEIGRAFAAKYSRDLEMEADYFGMKYAHFAGYDIEVGADVWERFAIEIPQSMVRDFLSTHPSSPERLVHIKKIIEEIKVDKIENKNE